MRTKRGRSVAIAAVVAAGLTLVVSACGGGGGGKSPTTTSSAAGQTFPVLKVVFGTTDYLDPGLSYRVASWQIFQDVYYGLLGKQYQSCTTGNCTKIIPMMAQSLPTVNKTGTDFKFTLRKGLKYSDGTPVKASDFKNSIIRDFKLQSPGIGFYSNIVGANACEKNPTKCSNISGIIVNDSAGTVEIKLNSPESDFEYVLTLPFSAMVPSSTPAKEQDNPPPPSDGPYYISNYQPSKSFVMLRNPNWKMNEIPGVPNGNPDKIEGTLTDNLSQSAQDVINGTVNYDENLLPTDRLSSLESQYKSQIKLWPTPSTYYFFMNESYPPFNNVDARKAVNYAIDRSQLVNIRGGLGVPTWNFLPPTYPQYKKITPTPYPYSIAKAKAEVQKSGTAGQTVTVWTIGDNAVDKATGEYLQGQLSKIGWHAQIKEIAGADYFVDIGNQKEKAQIGFTDWFEDFPYPSDWFNVLENGQNITPVHNNNNSNVNIKQVNSGIDQLDHLPPSQALSTTVNNGWATLDKTLMVKYASEAPYLNSIQTSFFSSKMNPTCDIFDDWFDNLDQMCMK